MTGSFTHDKYNKCSKPIDIIGFDYFDSNQDSHVGGNKLFFPSAVSKQFVLLGLLDIANQKDKEKGLYINNENKWKYDGSHISGD